MIHSMQSTRPRWVRRVGIGAVAASVAGGAIAWQAAPSGAAPTAAAVRAPQVHRIDFQADGPTPATLTIDSGDSLVFRNDVDPADSVPVLGEASSMLSNVTITVSGATQTPFTLEPGQEARVGVYRSNGTQFVVHFTGGYSSTEVGGAIQGPTKQTVGTVVVRASRMAASHRPLGLGPDLLPVRAEIGWNVQH